VVGARLGAFPVSSISPLRRRTVSLTIPVAFPTLSHQRYVVRLYVSMWGREGGNGKGATVEHTYRLRIYNKVYTNISSCRLNTRIYSRSSNVANECLADASRSILRLILPILSLHKRNLTQRNPREPPGNLHVSSTIPVNRRLHATARWLAMRSSL